MNNSSPTSKIFSLKFNVSRTIFSLVDYSSLSVAEAVADGNKLTIYWNQVNTAGLSGFFACYIKN